MGVYRGGCAGPSLLTSFDKDPGGSRDVESFTTEPVTKQVQEGPRGVRGHRLQKTAPLRPALLTRVGLVRSARAPGTALGWRRLPRPTAAFTLRSHIVSPSSMGEPAFYKTCAPSKPSVFQRRPTSV